MKQARIVARKPTKKGHRFWYALVDDAASVGDKPLQSATARHQSGDPSLVDPDEQRQALANLTAWADENGWDVVV